MASSNKIKNQLDGSNPKITVSPIHRLLTKQVTRKQFLSVLGFGFLGILGFSSLVHFLTGKHPSTKIASITSKSSSSYGHKS